MTLSTHIVVDLGFGDAGKGTMVDAIARRCSSPPLVVRHNGGAQAGHNVHLSDGRHHTFSQFGAATFVPGSHTLLSQHFVLHPTGLMAEHEHLVSVGVKDALDRLVVDKRALVITPFHQAMNQLREAARGVSRHGTCGIGVGETVDYSLQYPADEIRVGDLRSKSTLLDKLAVISERLLRQIEPQLYLLDPADPNLALLRNLSAITTMTRSFMEIGARLQIASSDQANAAVRYAEHVIFEGAQGVLLDEWYGFHPHTTWSTTTTQRADELIEQANRAGPVTKFGVLRAYATRHGPGPFPTENAMLTEKLREVTNTDDGPQGAFRCGWFDTLLTSYALRACTGISSLAVTCLDRLPAVAEWKFCDFYNQYQSVELRAKVGDLRHQELLARQLARCTPVTRPVPSDAGGYVRAIEDALGLPVICESHGPTAEDKLWRR